MPVITELNGIRINSLQTIPSLSDNTLLMVQRGTNTSEKSTLSALKTYLNISFSISTAIDSHTNAVDPHGDRAYSQLLMNNHKAEADPHNHKAYTNNTLTVHLSATDPHGDRAYSDSKLNLHLTDEDPHGLITIIEDSFNDHSLLENVHNIEGQITTAIAGLRNTENGFASLDSNLKIPSVYLPSQNQQVSFTYSKPIVGVPNVIYVDLTDNKQYYWGSSNSYVALTPTLDIGGISLTTDDIPQSTTNLNRRYYTEAIETTINSSLSQKVGTVTTVGTGKSIVKSKTASTLTLKSLKSSSSITVVENADDLTLQATVGLTAISYNPTTNIGYKTYTNNILEVFGNVTIDSTNIASYTVTFPQSFTDTDYTLITTIEENQRQLLSVTSKTTTGFTVGLIDSDGQAVAPSSYITKLNFQCIGITS